MKQLLNTLYVTTEGAYLHLDHDNLRVEVERETRLQVPLHHLGAVVCFGDVLITPSLLAKCAEDGRTVVFLSPSGRFRCRVVGPVTGNVLLRQAQYQAAADDEKCAAIARAIVAGKIRNSRESLLRGARDAKRDADEEALRAAARELSRLLGALKETDDLEAIRGHEGAAARSYFSAFNHLIREDCREQFHFEKRTRRPPRDRMNALLSFLYTLVLNDCLAGAQGVGLDPQMGFLHALRPGRPALGLDLMEELRPVLADRLAITLVNRAQITSGDFIERTGGAVEFTDEARKKVVVAYQQRKQDAVLHKALDEKVPLGLVPHVQARLLARHLRGDIAEYTPFLYR